RWQAGPFPSLRRFVDAVLAVKTIPSCKDSPGGVLQRINALPVSLPRLVRGVTLFLYTSFKKVNEFRQKKGPADELMSSQHVVQLISQAFAGRANRKQFLLRAALLNRDGPAHLLHLLSLQDCLGHKG